LKSLQKERKKREKQKKKKSNYPYLQTYDSILNTGYWMEIQKFPPEDSLDLMSTFWKVAGYTINI
jgi:hypothetical protein